MLFKNFSSFGVRNSSVRCRDRIMSRPARKVKLRSTIPTTSSLLVGEIDPEISKHADGYPIYNMEETPPIIGRRRRFPDEFSSGSPISGKSKRTEDIFIREDEDGIRSHYCPLNPELDGRDWNEDYPETFDFNIEKFINSCSVPSEDIPLLLSSKSLSSESDEESDGSVVSYVPLESEASTSRNSTVSLTNVGYTPLEDEPSTNENSPVSQKNLTSRFLQWPEKTSSYARLEEETMESWLDDSSDEFEYYAPHVKYLPDVKFTIQDGSDMEEFEQDSDSENEKDNLKSAKNKEKKGGGYNDKGDRDEGYKDFLADSKYSKNKVENESSTEYPSKLSKIEHSESKTACKNKRLSNLDEQDKNEYEEEYPEINKDEGNKDLSAYTTSTENNAKNESSTELSNKMSKIEHLKREYANKNEQTSNLNTQDEKQKEKEHVKINSESDSIVIDLHYSDNEDRNNIESKLNTQDENKDKKEGKESENASKNEQSRNLNAGDENQNKKKHPEYNIESYSTALDIHLLDNVDRNGIESSLNIQDVYKDKKGEKENDNTNKNEKQTNLNAEDENQNEKKYPDYNIESVSTAIGINNAIGAIGIDNVYGNGIELNLRTHDDYKDKKEEKGSESTNENEQSTNLNAKDENQNEKQYPENNIESDSFAIDIPLLDNVDRNGIESNLSTQDDYKDKKEEKGSESTNKNEQSTNLNAEDENQNEKKYPENNIESYSFAIDIPLLDNVARNGIESNLSTQDDYKDKKEEKENESTNKNEQSKNLNAEDENQNEKKYPENNIESDSFTIDIPLLDNVDRNGIESNLSAQDDYKDKKEEKGSESTNNNEQSINLNAEDENQNEKKYPENNKERDYFSIDIPLLDNVGIESNMSTQDHYKNKKEEKRSESTNKNEQSKNLNVEDENQNEKKYAENNIESDSFAIDIPLLDNVDRNGIESNLSTQDDYKDKKEEKGSESTNKNEQSTNLNAEDENQNEKKYPENNIESYSFAIDIPLLDNVARNGIESNLSTQDDYKDKKEEKENESTNKNEQSKNLNAEDENQNEKKYPENNIESDSFTIDIPLLDNVDRNGIESNLSAQDDYKDKKEEKGSESTNNNEQSINLNAEDENQNEKKYPENNKERDYFSIDIPLLDNVGIESNMSTQDHYKDKKEEKRSESTNKNEQSKNLNVEDENQNEKKYAENNIESDSFAIDIPLLDNVDRNGIESNLSTQDDYKDKKEEKGSESTNKNEQSTNLNAEDENQNDKKYPENNIESDSFSIDIPLLDNIDRNGIESNLSTQDDYKDKKEENRSESTNENEQSTNLNAEDENQNEKKYPENIIESDCFTIDIPLLDNVVRNGIESNLSTQDDYKDKKEEKGSESTNENEQTTNLNAEDENQNEKKYPESNIESDSFTIDILLLNNADRNVIESNMNMHDDNKDENKEKESECTNKNEQITNLNAEDENQNEKKYPDYNIESDYFTIDILLLDNADRNDIESNMNTHDDNKDENKEKESESTDKNEQLTNLNAEDENQIEKKYLENNLENDSTETDIHYLNITDRNGIESNLNTRDENKDEKEESEKDSKNDYFSNDISLPDLANINGPVSNLNTHSIARLKFRDLLRTLLPDDNKDKKEEPESYSKNGFISGVIPLVDFDNINRPVSNLNIQDENKDKIMQTESYSKVDYIFEITNNINGPVSNLSIQDENKDKNIQTESDSKDDYIFEITNFRDFVSLHGSVSNLNTQDENNSFKMQEAANDLKNDYIFDIISFPDFVSLNGSASSLSTHDKNKGKKELESDSKNFFISEGISLSDSDSIHEPVSNLTTRDENKDKKEHPESDLKTDYISESIHWAEFDSVNVPVSNSNTQDKNKVKNEHLESNLETGFAENFLHCTDNGQKEKYVSEIGGFSNKMDDGRDDFSYDFFPKSQTEPAIKPKIKEDMATLTAEPYGRTIPKSIKKDETHPGLKRLQRFMSGIYPTKDKNELHFEPSITSDVGEKMPLEEKGIIFDINDALMLAELPVHDSGGFQPVLTEEQRVASRQPNKFTKFFQSLKKKLERNKKA